MTRFTIQFSVLQEDRRVRTPDPITHIDTVLEVVKAKAEMLFETLNLPQKPMACDFCNQDGDEVFFWTRGVDNA